MCAELSADTATDRQYSCLSANTLTVPPRIMVTDKLRSYAAAHREVMPVVMHEQGKHKNSRAE